MNGKIMQEFVEEQRGLTAEYVFATVSSQNTATLTFSSQPIFVSMSFYISDLTFTVNTAFTSTIRSCYFAMDGANGYCNVRFSGSRMLLSQLSNANKVYAVGFF